MIGKLIAFADNREMAIAKMSMALDEIVIEGIKTNVPLHQMLVRDVGFKNAGAIIHYLEKKLQR